MKVWVVYADFGPDNRSNTFYGIPEKVFWLKREATVWASAQAEDMLIEELEVE